MQKEHQMLLADIGNSRVHLYDGKRVLHLSHEDALRQYHTSAVVYISVSNALQPKLSSMGAWQDISECLNLQGAYSTMGVDRKALCLSRDDGVFVDAGSAITVDVVKQGVYQGGFILLGIQAYLRAYKSISPVLDIELERGYPFDSLPKTTKDSISYGIIASIKNTIDTHRDNLPLYFTGGDGKWLSSFFTDVIYDETLVFQGMQKALKDTRC